MQQSMVFTFISDDKTGIVEQLSQAVSTAGGNWLESRLTKLAGKFAGFVQISIGENNIDALQKSLDALASQGIVVLLQNNHVTASETNEQQLKLTILGLDRPGIVKELAGAFMSHHLNIIDMHSYTESAAMSGEELFKAELSLDINQAMDQDAFNDEIESVCNELDLDWTLTEVN